MFSAIAQCPIRKLAQVCLLSALLVACPEQISDLQCGIGERVVDDRCLQVPYLQIHFDERLDVSRGGVREGIGANACFYERDEQEILVDSGACQTVRFSGSSSAVAVPISAGGIAVHLPVPFVMNKPDEDPCYQSQFDGNRTRLYDDEKPFMVEIFGGGDLEPTPFAIQPPPPISLIHDEELQEGVEFNISWPVAQRPARHVLAVLRVHDGDEDQSIHAVCFFPDTGEAAFSTDVIAPLFTTPDPRATLYVLRQNWVHIEPYEEGMTIEAFASRSEVDDVLLLPLE